MGKHVSTYKATSPYPTTAYPEATLALDVELLMGICKQQGDSGNEKLEIIPHLVTLIEGMGLEPLFDKKGNMYVTKGESSIYPCMVAHLDTVHDYEDNFDVALSADGKVLYALAAGEPDANLTRLSPLVKQAGVGGDDRVGVAIAMQLLKEFDNFKVVFFLEEEIGCRGSREAYMPFFDDVSLVLQCDRQGSADWVQTVAGTKVSSDAFIQSIQPLLTQHSYRTIQNGGITDVGQLKLQGLPVCAANMSCGYYAPHSSSETIYLPAMQNTLSLCYSIYLLLGHEKQEHVYTPYKYTAPVNKAYVPSFYPKDHGWIQVEIVETVTPVHGRPYDKKLWLWEKRISEGQVLGPVPYNETEKLEKEYQAQVAADQAKVEQEGIKAKKKRIREWIDLDGTWRFNKKAKLWEKYLKETIEGVETEYNVAIASTILDVPFQEGEFRLEYEQDILHGIMTVKEVHDYIQLEREEELAILKERQMNLPFSTGSERETFSGGYDDEGRYLPMRIRPQIEDFGLESVTCPHCNSMDERFVSLESKRFYCMDCMMYSDEAVDDFRQLTDGYDATADADKGLYNSLTDKAEPLSDLTNAYKHTQLADAHDAD